MNINRYHLYTYTYYYVYLCLSRSLYDVFPIQGHTGVRFQNPQAMEIRAVSCQLRHLGMTPDTAVGESQSMWTNGGQKEGTLKAN